MILIELFERDKKAPPSPEEIRLKTILSVMSRRMKKDKLPSMIPWDRLGRVLDKSGVPFSTDQVRAYIEKDFSDRLSMDDRGNIKVVSASDIDFDTDSTGGLDDFDPYGDHAPGYRSCCRTSHQNQIGVLLSNLSHQRPFSPIPIPTTSKNGNNPTHFFIGHLPGFF